MDKKIIAAISLCALFFSLMLVGSSVKFGLSNDYHIHNINTGIDYFTIQEAINAAETLNGHVILVDAGIYYESAVVNKTLTIIGDNAETVIIDGEDNAAYMFQVMMAAARDA